MAQVTEITVPDLGDFADIPVIEVLVAPGDRVAVESPLVTLESDKATMDVPSTVAGVVAELRVAVGDRVSAGTPILTLTPESAPPAAESPAAVADAPTPVETPAAAPAPPAEPTPSAPPAATTTAAPDTDSAGRSVYASPSVRRRARELNVDLTTVVGTGRNGRIVLADLEGAPASVDRPAVSTTARGGGTAVTGSALDLAPWPQIDFAQFGPVEREPRTRIAKIAGRYLQRNWVTIPHVTQFDEADITDLEAFRKLTNEENKDAGVKVTMVALVLKACVASLREHPHVNASLDGDDLILKRYYHLGFAADTPQGLVVPVIRDVDQKGILDIARELAELSGKAREGALSPAEMSGGTFTLSSLGGIGGTAFTPIVNAPEVAILGVSRSSQKPVWNGSEFAPRLMLPLSFSYDHRVIDGAEAARFTTHLAGVLSDLRRVLL